MHISLSESRRGPLWSRCLKDMLSDVTSSFCQRDFHILGNRVLTLSLHLRGCQKFHPKLILANIGHCNFGTSWYKHRCFHFFNPSTFICQSLLPGKVGQVAYGVKGAATPANYPEYLNVGYTESISCLIFPPERSPNPRTSIVPRVEERVCHGKASLACFCELCPDLTSGLQGDRGQGLCISQFLRVYHFVVAAWRHACVLYLLCVCVWCLWGVRGFMCRYLIRSSFSSLVQKYLPHIFVLL